MNNEVEQVLKEFEELGYEVEAKANSIWYFINEKQNVVIKINTLKRLYFVKELGEEYYQYISLEEHQLLTKLFQALGWFDE